MKNNYLADSLKHDLVDSKISVTVYYHNQLKHKVTGEPLFNFFKNTKTPNPNSPKTSMVHFMKWVSEPTYPTELPSTSKANSLLEYQLGYELKKVFKLMETLVSNTNNKIHQILICTNTSRRLNVPNKQLCLIKYQNQKPVSAEIGKNLNDCTNDEAFLIEMFTTRFPPFFINTFQ